MTLRPGPARQDRYATYTCQPRHPRRLPDLRPRREHRLHPRRRARTVAGPHAHVVGRLIRQPRQFMGRRRHRVVGRRPGGRGLRLGLHVVFVRPPARGPRPPGQRHPVGEHGGRRGRGRAGRHLQRGPRLRRGGRMPLLVEGRHPQLVGRVRRQVRQFPGGAGHFEDRRVRRRVRHPPGHAVARGQAPRGGFLPGQPQRVPRGRHRQVRHRRRRRRRRHRRQGLHRREDPRALVRQRLQPVAVDVPVGHRVVRGGQGRGPQVRTQLRPGPRVGLPPRPVPRHGGPAQGRAPGQADFPRRQRRRETLRGGRRLRQGTGGTVSRTRPGRQPEGACGTLPEEQHPPPAVRRLQLCRQIIGPTRQVGREGRRHRRVRPRLRTAPCSGYGSNPPSVSCGRERPVASPEGVPTPALLRALTR